MNREDIIKRLNELNLPKDSYWICAGSAMAMYGLREETHDIDLGCTKKLADEIEIKYPTSLRGNRRRIELAEDIEMYEEMCVGDINLIDDLPVVSLNSVLKMKKALNRPKDKKDIEIIEKYLLATATDNK